MWKALLAGLAGLAVGYVVAKAVMMLPKQAQAPAPPPSPAPTNGHDCPPGWVCYSPVEKIGYTLDPGTPNYRAVFDAAKRIIGRRTA